MMQPFNKEGYLFNMVHPHPVHVKAHFANWSVEFHEDPNKSMEDEWNIT